MSLILKFLNYFKKLELRIKVNSPFVKVGILWDGSCSAIPLVWKARGAPLLFSRTSAACMNGTLSQAA